jgi:hypothetical protein
MNALLKNRAMPDVEAPTSSCPLTGIQAFDLAGNPKPSPATADGHRLGQPTGTTAPACEISPELKYASRLGEIQYRMSANTELTLRTSHCARNMRRDFNIASAKMYVYSLDHAYKRLISNAISDLSHELTLLAATVMPYRHYEISNLVPIKYKVLVISAESAALMKSLSTADRLFAHLYEAEFREVITRAQRFQIMMPFMIVYSHFKKVALKIDTPGIDDVLKTLGLDQ